ncbi:MAG: 3-dehydroquinate synthase [Desulfobacterales bacterium]|nr:MAG: 3-dehydroquinate synthase [Desulfobacterales bacterium]
MQVLEIHGRERDSRIIFGGRLPDLKTYLPPAKAVIVTDRNVRHYYGKDLAAWNVIEIGTGEKIKNLDTVREIYARLIECGADRSTFIVGVGGGIVCDVAGFAASTYQRGLKFGFVATTLLAQVDASVGGKNGVNFAGYKNMVGVFNQPEFVICDLQLLRTLPSREVSCGLAEIVKHALIADADLFAYLEGNSAKAVRLDLEVIAKLVYDSVAIKSSIVNRDEKEKGERRQLNFGHTFGHAIEKIAGVPHGEAISAGMVLASALSVRRGLLSAEDQQRIKRLLVQLKLPTQIPVSADRLMEALAKDKKRWGDRLHFVLLAGLGKAVVEEISMPTMRELIRELDEFAIL